MYGRSFTSRGTCQRATIISGMIGDDLLQHQVAFSEVNLRPVGVGGGGIDADDEDNLAFTVELEEVGPQKRLVVLTVYPFHDIEVRFD